ncbi:MAG: hypothetical protein ACRC1T_05300 [Clostridium chrysemydis]|uniref:hypothetical protein n=1 Tax=Clostridium chrysemydis TaxID=2665504 RepID=UPI003F403B35
MIQVIQTNQSLNVFGKERDFQSFVKEYNLLNVPEYSEWEVFKDSIKDGERPGLKKKNAPIEVVIDDDFHLEVLYKENENMFSKSQFYLVHSYYKEEIE